MDPNNKKGYGKHKFIISDLQQIKKALGFVNLSNNEKNLFLKEKNQFYEELDPPVEGDWLWIYKESDQFYNNYVKYPINQPTSKKNTIYIKNLDYGMEDSLLTNDILEHLRSILEAYYVSVKVKIINDKENLETLKITSRNNYYLQYHAGEINNKLASNIPSDGILMIGFTSFDLYPSEKWNFVFGLAFDKKRCGVFSMRRYYDDDLFKELKLINEKLFISTVVKWTVRTMVHEVGHLFGLNHCIYFKCIMNGSNSMTEDMKSKAFDFCPVCLRKISFLMKFNIIERFNIISKAMKKICDIYSEQIDWFDKRYKDALQYK